MDERQRNEAIVGALLNWFSRNARDLPWRRTRDPYAIWASEIMLQQTQVRTVLPYFDRWMEELPTVESLARARPTMIHKLWEGLGYYTRVRNMQKAAQVIVNQHGGKVPNRFDDLLALPGVGKYTAGAIASIAFNQPKPILDGNVIRVLSRMFAVSGDPREKQINARLWHLAEELVTASARINLTVNDGRGRGSCSRFNQSLMELGALVCTPREPACATCPVSRLCKAHLSASVDRYPTRASRSETVPRHFIAFISECRGRFLVKQRPSGVVNAHLWEFPNIEVNGKPPNLKALCRHALGFAPRKLSKFHRVNHSITKYRITLDAFRTAGYPANSVDSRSGQWLTPAQMNRLPFTAAHKKLLERLRAEVL